MKILTHDGVFHADEVTAVAILVAICRRRGEDALLSRSRKGEDIQKADVVVDVGGIYDASAMRFDHHQPGRAGARSNGVQYSSAGLIWRHFGLELLEGDEEMWADIDRTLIQPIDASDNGQELYTRGTPAFEGVTGISLSQVVSGFNPSWEKESFEVAMIRFRDAVDFMQRLLDREIDRAHGTKNAAKIVWEALGMRRDPRVLVLSRYVPWQRFVTDEEQLLFVVYRDQAGKFMASAVPAKAGGFSSKKLFPANWGGLPCAELRATTGISDAVFCHPGRFIAGAESLEGALAMVEAALSA